jgi:hypothetical protein
MASVTFLVKTISLGEPALRSPATLARPASYAAVVSSAIV